MIVSPTLIAQAIALTPGEIATIKVLPFLGITVVIAGLSILAIILTQFRRLEDAKPGDKKKHGHAAPAPAAAAPAAPATSADEDESAAVSTAIFLYLQQSAEPVAITEIPQEHHSTPWIDFGKQRQQFRFQRWQSSSTKAR
jgi:Na+-transporting methylmalonyl-CoA/oxaloacetate decarboxylase gamma subunit